MPSFFDRRRFLQSSLGASALVSVGLAAPQFIVRTARAVGTAPAGGQRVLVVLQLSGGNDGLNTVVPYSDPAYRTSRPSLRLNESQVLKLQDGLGLHPNLTGLVELWEAGQLAIVQGTGYPNPNRSHFESMDIWHSARPGATEHRVGWLGRLLDDEAERWESAERGPPGERTGAPALHLGGEKLPLALLGRRAAVPSIRSLDSFRLRNEHGGLAAPALRELADVPRSDPSPLLEFVRRNTLTAFEASGRLQESAARSTAAAEYPGFGLAAKLRLIAQLIDAGLSTRIYYVSLDGFDTHAAQAPAHAALMSELGASLRAFFRDLEQRGQLDRIAVLAFSEFGRRVRENASAGTDHGVAGPVFVAGGRVAGGIIGRHPSLVDLDSGDLKHAIDFRQVYATLLDRWLGADSRSLLGGEFAPAPLFKG